MNTHTYGKLILCGHTHYVGCDPCGCDQWVKVKPETVTITISRETADDIVNPPLGQEDGASISVLDGTVGICIHIRASLGDNNADIS
jgi:hypothetical protein